MPTDPKKDFSKEVLEGVRAMAECGEWLVGDDTCTVFPKKDCIEVSLGEDDDGVETIQIYKLVLDRVERR